MMNCQRTKLFLYFISSKLYWDLERECERYAQFNVNSMASGCPRAPSLVLLSLLFRVTAIFGIKRQ